MHYYFIPISRGPLREHFSFNSSTRKITQEEIYLSSYGLQIKLGFVLGYIFHAQEFNTHYERPFLIVVFYQQRGLPLHLACKLSQR